MQAAVKFRTIKGGPFPPELRDTWPMSSKQDLLMNRTSLSRTLDAINAVLIDGRMLATTDRAQAARWIAARHGLPGAYGGTFAGFPSERSSGIVLFTGERIESASARHILGEEASRALPTTRVSAIPVSTAAARAAWDCGGTCSPAV